jgi:sugar lactone lactonase YvrE
MRYAWVVFAAGCGSSSSPPDPPLPDAPATTEIEELAQVGEPGALTVDATHVYFTHGADISRVAKSGGTVGAVAVAQRGPTSLDATTDRLCWVNSGTHAQDFLDGSVRCAPKTGGGDVQLATSYFPSALAIADGVAYWTEIDGQAVRRIALDGTQPQTIDDAPTSKVGIAIGTGYVAWTATGPDADVVAMDRASGAKTPLSTAEYSPNAVIVDGDDVYWVTRHAQSEEGAVRVARDLGTALDLAPGEYWPSQLVRAGDTLYWVSYDRIRAVAMAGGAPSTIVEGRGPIGGIASDGEYLYWAERDRGAIARKRL